MKMIKKQPHKSMERLSGNVQESESDREKTPVTAPYCYKEMCRQINNAFAPPLQSLTQKWANCLPWESLPKRHCCHWSVPAFAGHPCLSQSTHASPRAGQARSTTLKEEMAGKNAIFMLRESRSWKHQSQWHENCQQEQIITQREFILMTMTLMR